jgi:hypothetical protein
VAHAKGDAGQLWQGVAWRWLRPCRGEAYALARAMPEQGQSPRYQRGAAPYHALALRESAAALYKVTGYAALDLGKARYALHRHGAD